MTVWLPRWMVDGAFLAIAATALALLWLAAMNRLWLAVRRFAMARGIWADVWTVAMKRRYEERQRTGKPPWWALW
ncbi:MAG: hypothetical protein KGK07_07405 [Chloroflexota bacterium]|nr:hypothetical protein [Chloroflexota bacterium]